MFHMKVTLTMAPLSPMNKQNKANWSE